ncbi:hypothetical protein D9758_004110 [Tetrapyrgos nigripes]|uniref:LysM domain-containing protein n=1 Tax=Tetrapyrgos nigripes TaxID=182062 RepID=A0A8H5GU03_9AGAR|nr:hypothetical protein D9758_004110 [Tetrapyrgos nigripes]
MVVLSTLLLASALTVSGHPFVRSPQHNPRNLEARSTSAAATQTSVSVCNKAPHVVVSGDLCYKIAADNSLTLSQLQSYNSGVNCNNLQIGASLKLCPASTVSVSGTTTGTTTTATSSTSTSSGIACSKTYKVKSGDYDEIIAPKAGITVDQLYAANPNVDWDDLQVGQILNIPCAATSTAASTTASGTTVSTTASGSTTTVVSTSGTATTTTSSATQSATCPNSYKVKSGDYDEVIAPKFNITVKQLYAANPNVDWDNLQIGQTLNIPCAVASTAVTTSTASRTASTTTVSATTTTATTSGTVSGTTTSSSATSTATCPKIYKVKSDDYDEKIASKSNITVAQLYAANPNVDWDDLQTGQSLNIPCAVTSTTTGSTTRTTTVSASGSTTASTNATTTASGSTTTATGSTNATTTASGTTTATTSTSTATSSFKCTQSVNVTTASTCGQFLTAHNLTEAQFMSMNPDTCTRRGQFRSSTSLSVGDVLCVAGSNSTTTATNATTTNTATGSTNTNATTTTTTGTATNTTTGSTNTTATTTTASGTASATNSNSNTTTRTGTTTASTSSSSSTSSTCARSVTLSAATRCGDFINAQNLTSAKFMQLNAGVCVRSGNFHSSGNLSSGQTLCVA